MLEKPDLADETIVACLHASYGLSVGRLDFLPIGNDSSARVYRVGARDGTSYFLKVKQGTLYQPSVIIPHHLKNSGIKSIIAPLPNLAGALWATADTFTLILYPFVEGSTGMETGMSEEQWTAFGSILKRIHTTALSEEAFAVVENETFMPRWSGTIRLLQAHMLANDYTDSFQQELAAFWKAKAAEIITIVDRTEAIGRRLQAQAPELVLCHSDIHTANILLDADGKLFIVDWDQPVFAPKERDLMFVMRGNGGSESTDEQCFFKGYGQPEINNLALAYYRCEWVVQEIGDYGTRVFLTPNMGAETKQDSLRGFQQLFLPGDVVEAAERSWVSSTRN
jgi:spectinomycin phosphotransferase